MQLLQFRMDPRQNNERPTTSDKPLRPSTTNKYTYKGNSQPFKLENVYFDKNNQLMIKTQHEIGRRLTSKQMQEYTKINPKMKDKNADEIWRRNLLGKVNPSFEETNNLTKGKKVDSKQFQDEYQIKQVDKLYNNVAQNKQSPKLKKKSSNQRQILEAVVQKNLDDKFAILQQRLKLLQESRKQDKLEISNNSQQSRLLKKQLEELITKVSLQNTKEHQHLVQLMIDHKKECKQQFEEIRKKLSLALSENNSSSMSYRDSKTLKMQREQAKNLSNQEQKQKTISMKRELEKLKSQLILKQQVQKETRKRYEKLQGQNRLIIARQKSLQEKYTVLERKYQQSIKTIEKLSPNKLSTSEILFFSPTVFQKKLQNFLKQSIQKAIKKTITSAKLLYQLDEFNLSASNYLTRPPFPILFLITSEANHTFAIFSQGIQNHVSRKMRIQQNIQKQFKTILLNCQTQMVIEKDQKSQINCGANFMENQLIIGSNELVLKNNNLRTLKFYGNNFFGDKYFNIKKRSYLTCEDQDEIALKAFEIYELFLL